MPYDDSKFPRYNTVLVEDDLPRVIPPRTIGTDVDQPKAPQAVTTPVVRKKRRVVAPEEQGGYAGIVARRNATTPIMARTGNVADDEIGYASRDWKPTPSTTRQTTPVQPTPETIFRNARIDSDRLTRATGKPQTIGQAMASRTPRQEDIGILSSKPESNPLLADDEIGYASRDFKEPVYQFPEKPRSLGERIGAGLAGVAEGIGLGSQLDIDPYALLHGDMRAPVRPSRLEESFGETPSFETGKAGGQLAKIIGLSMSPLGPVAGSAIGMGTTAGGENIRQQLRDKNAIDTVEATKETLKGTAKGVAYGLFGKLPLVNQTISKIAGPAGAGYGRAAAATIARPVLGGIENAIASQIVERGIDKGYDIATGEDTYSRNPYVIDPRSRILPDVGFGAALTGLFSAIPGYKGYKAGGAQEALREFGTGGYRPPTPEGQAIAPVAPVPTDQLTRQKPVRYDTLSGEMFDPYRTQEIPGKERFTTQRMPVEQPPVTTRQQELESLGISLDVTGQPMFPELSSADLQANNRTRPFTALPDINIGETQPLLDVNRGREYRQGLTEGQYPEYSEGRITQKISPERRRLLAASRDEKNFKLRQMGLIDPTKNPVRAADVGSPQTLALPNVMNNAAPSPITRYLDESLPGSEVIPPTMEQLIAKGYARDRRPIQQNLTGQDNVQVDNIQIDPFSTGITQKQNFDNVVLEPNSQEVTAPKPAPKKDVRDARKPLTEEEVKGTDWRTLEQRGVLEKEIRNQKEKWQPSEADRERERINRGTFKVQIDPKFEENIRRSPGKPVSIPVPESKAVETPTMPVRNAGQEQFDFTESPQQKAWRILEEKAAAQRARKVTPKQKAVKKDRPTKEFPEYAKEELTSRMPGYVAARARTLPEGGYELKTADLTKAQEPSTTVEQRNARRIEELNRESRIAKEKSKYQVALSRLRDTDELTPKDLPMIKSKEVDTAKEPATTSELRQMVKDVPAPVKGGNIIFDPTKGKSVKEVISEAVKEPVTSTKQGKIIGRTPKVVESPQVTLPNQEPTGKAVTAPLEPKELKGAKGIQGAKPTPTTNAKSIVQANQGQIKAPQAQMKAAEGKAVAISRPATPMSGKDFSIPMKGSPGYKVGQEPKKIAPVAAKPAEAVPSKVTPTSKPLTGKEDLTGFPEATQKRLKPLQTKIAEAEATMRQAEQVNKDYPDDIKGGKDRIAAANQKIETAMSSYQKAYKEASDVAQRQKADEALKAKVKEELYGKPLTALEEANKQADIAAETFNKTITEQAADIEKTVKTAEREAKRAMQQAELTGKRGKEVKAQKALEQVEAFNAAKKLSNINQIMARAIKAWKATRSISKTWASLDDMLDTYKGAVREIVKDAPLGKIQVESGSSKGTRVAIIEEGKRLEATVTDKWTDQEGEQYLELRFDDDTTAKVPLASVRPIEGESPLAKSATKAVTLFEKAIELRKQAEKIEQVDQKQQKSLGEEFNKLMKAIPFASQKGALGVLRRSNPQQQAAKFQAALKNFGSSLASYVSNSYKNLNRANVRKVISGRKGILETAVTAYNVGKLMFPKQRIKDILGTVSVHVMDNMLARPIMAMADMTQSVIKGSPRNTLMPTIGEYVGDAATVGADAVTAFIRGQRAILGEKYMSAEALRQYKGDPRNVYAGGKIEGILGKYTLTNPILRAMTETDTVMRQGIRKRAIRDQIKLTAVNEYLQAKAAKTPNLPSQSVFIKQRSMALADIVGKQSAGQRISSKDYAVARKIRTNAESVAAEGVLQQDNAITNALESFFSSSKKIAKKTGEEDIAEGMHFLAKALWPFIKVRANAAIKIADYTPPVALGRGIYGLVKGDQKLISQAIAQGAVGTGLAMLGWANYQAFAPPAEFLEDSPEDKKIKNLNEAKNARSQDLNLREAIEAATGVDVPGMDYNAKVDYATALMTLVGIGSRMRYEAERQNIEDEADEDLSLTSLFSSNPEFAATEKLYQVLEAAVSTTPASVTTIALAHPATSTIGTGLNKFLEEGSGKSKSGLSQGMSAMAADIVSDLPYAIPGLNPLMAASSIAAQVTDPYQRQKESPSKDFTQALKDKLQTRIPFEMGGYGREAMPEKLDAFGDLVENVGTGVLGEGIPGRALNALDALFNPLDLKRYNRDELLDFMTEYVTGPTRIQRGKDLDLEGYGFKQEDLGAGSYDAAQQFMRNFPANASDREVVKGLAEAMGRGKETAAEAAFDKSKPKRVTIDKQAARKLVESMRLSEQNQQKKAERRGY